MIRKLKTCNPPPPVSGGIVRLLTITSEDAVKEIKEGSNDKDAYIKKLEERLVEVGYELNQLKMDLYAVPNPNVDEKDVERIKRNTYDALKMVSEKSARKMIQVNYNDYAMTEMRKEFPEYADAISEAIEEYEDDLQRESRQAKTNTDVKKPKQVKRTSHEDIRPDN